MDANLIHQRIRERRNQEDAEKAALQKAANSNKEIELKGPNIIYITKGKQGKILNIHWPKSSSCLTLKMSVRTVF